MQSIKEILEELNFLNTSPETAFRGLREKTFAELETFREALLIQFKFDEENCCLNESKGAPLGDLPER